MIHCITRFRKGRIGGEEGTAAIEFALMIPLLLTLMMGVVDLGFAIYTGMQVYSAAEAGALYAARNGWDSAGISSAVTGATGTSGITATPAPTHFCGCPTASGVVTWTCGTNCASGSTAGQYARINASLAYSTILPYAALGLPSTFTAKSVVRLH
jgi:Flp pilus assembly protein TadG